MGGCHLLDGETAGLLERQRETFDRHEDRFVAARELVPDLGAHWTGEYATFGFWTPELRDAGVPAGDVYLECLTPPADADYATGGTLAFERDLVATRRAGAFTWAAVGGAVPGTRDRPGTLYRLVYEDGSERRTIGDPLAASLPFGAFAPAELYDLESLHADRADRDYFRRLPEPGVAPRADGTVDEDHPRFGPATNLLEIHPGTATESGSLAGLTRLFEEIGRKQRAGEELTPAERNFAGYDAVQLMPVEPLTENADHPGYWRPGTDLPVGPEPDEVTVTVEHPDMINWGYDVVISGFGAVNPAILETARPDELVEFIATLHTLPEPTKVVFDVALGHADGAATDLLNDYYFSGPGMYGQELDYTHPVVRATLLDLQRRKMDFGADGIRVDGAQDFTNYDPERGEYHDDAFLASMDQVQSVAGQRYYPWLIYEDGRPWPRGDWELASTYRALIDQHPHAYQWGPVTFAHNTPALLTFWATKWWRVREVADLGGHWISGVANHDTLRRGSQLPVPEGWEGDPINPYLGADPPEIYERAYDNPATNALTYAVLPGVPMDFAHANMRAPWGFVRDTDAGWSVKVVAEEHNFVDWQVRERHFEGDHFPRLRELGFEDPGTLGEFADALAAAVETVGQDLETVSAMLSALDTPLDGPTPAELERFATAWMRDVAEFCTLDRWWDDQDDARTAFDRSVREFRRDRPWLRAPLGDDEHFDYRHPADGTVVYYGLRRAPDGNESVLFLANMEGVETTLIPTDLPIPDLPAEGWEPALVAPSLDGGSVASASDPVALANSEAVVFTRSP